MAAYFRPAAGAFLPLLLLFKKRPDAILLDELEVFYHAHTKGSSITFINISEPGAWEILAFVAVLHLTVKD